MSKVYITTPIYYSNADPHLGHTYTTLLADILASYYRLKNRDVFFLTGLDEHGSKIEETARESGLNPQELCDQKAEVFQKAWQEFGFRYDNFIRTSDPFHIKVVQKVLIFLKKKNLIYKDFYRGLYCLGCEQFKTETDLVDGKCPDHQKEPILMEEESYFFKLSQFSDDLARRIANNEIEILPLSRRNEVLEFYKLGLKDISISRQKVKWGIEFPFDSNFTVYVWIDAFLNYLTGLGWDGNLKDIPDFWPPSVQLMSKDIIRVHSTIWLGLIRALELDFPKRLFSHGYFTVEGQKMSKSLGNVISPYDLIASFGREGSRFLLANSMNFGQDTDLSWQRLKDEYNDILVKNLGNLISRTLKLAENCYNQSKRFEFEEFLGEVWNNYHQNMESLKIKEALNETFRVINFANRYIDQERPWEDSCLRQGEIVSNLLIFIANLGLMLKPFIPETSRKIFSQLGIDEKAFNFDNWQNLKEIKFRPRKKELLFPKIS